MNTAAVLSRREAEVAPLLVYGKTKKEAANDLFRSVRTIENHARSIYEKTGCRNIAELCVWWFHKEYNTPINYSPLKRTVCTIVFLSLLISYDFNPRNNSPLFRANKTIAMRRVKRDTPYNPFEL